MAFEQPPGQAQRELLRQRIAQLSGVPSRAVQITRSRQQVGGGDDAAKAEGDGQEQDGGGARQSQLNATVVAARVRILGSALPASLMSAVAQSSTVTHPSSRPSSEASKSAVDQLGRRAPSRSSLTLVRSFEAEVQL